MATYVCDAQTGAEIERTTPINGRLRDDDSMMPMMRSHREHHGVGISRLVVCATFLDIPSFCLEDPVSVSDPLWSLYGSMASIFFAAPPPPPPPKKKKKKQLSYCRGEEAPHFLQVSSDPARDANCQSSTRFRLSNPGWGPVLLRVSFL